MHIIAPKERKNKEKGKKKPKIPPAVFCWSGGKDSAYCLYKVLTEKLYSVKYLLTTVNDNFKRISMHGVREELLDMQAEYIGIPLLKVRVKEGTNIEYEKQMETALLKAKSEGINHVIFGDIFLEDLREYRENNLAKLGMQAAFPIWKMSTTHLIHVLICHQFKSLICCAQDAYLGEKFLGRGINQQFLELLPTKVDPCGENGEYHTFCYDGPIFKKKINFTVGEKVFKTIEVEKDPVKEGGKELNSAITTSTNGFWYCDLLPEE